MKKTLILFLIFIGFAAINAQDVDFTFKVNMSVQIASGYFDPATDVVTVPGGFNNWLNEPPTNDTKVMSDEDGDKIYELTITMAPETYEFKFNIGTGWDGKDETTGNRSITVSEAGATEVYWYNNQSANGDPANITFKVNMSVQQEIGAFDPASEKVFVAGNFNDPGWGDGAIEMSDNDGDYIYEANYDQLVGGQEIEFKFIQSTSDAGSGDWETVDNRKVYVIDGDNTFEAYWDNIEGGNFGDGNITFTVDMSVMEEVGIYDPAVDSLQIRGGFNGWSDTEAEKSKMSQNFLAPNEWFITVPFVGAEIGGEQLYKYYVNKEDTTIGWEDGYERPLLQGGSNRPVEFEGVEDQNLPGAYYDDVLPAYVIEDGQTVAIEFSIDMTIAADPNEVALPFNAATDTVWWISDQPAFCVTQGWKDTDEMRVLEMTDDDGDMIYTGTLEITAPSWNGFEYRYGYGSPVNGFQAEPSGYGTYAYRVRYIEQAGARKFVQPYSAPVDTWHTGESKEDEWEEKPAGDIGTGVESYDATPSSFELTQNYPNPFNPTTMIKFSIPNSGMVSLKVHNVLGQEVATLVNKEMKAGTYEYSFNAANLSSGIYFYSIKIANNVATKKMMLLK